MALYELTEHNLRPVSTTTFRDAKIQERIGLQRVFREHIDVIAPGCMVIAEEFGEWEESRRRIDLLALDQDANIVVIELKRTEDGGHMELQAIRYAAMVSNMTFEQAVRCHERFLKAMGREEDAAANILEHLGWDEPKDDEFAQEVRIILASGDFSRELTGAVLWLNQRGLDIECVRLTPYEDNGRILLDIQQAIPLPEAEEYQVRVREKERKERDARKSGRDYTRFDVTIAGVCHKRLSKREMMLRIVQHLCSTGSSPTLITKAVEFRSGRLFTAVPAIVQSEAEFIEKARAAARAAGRKFDDRRYYTGDDERIVADGSTYAFINQWGGPGVTQWLDELRETYPLDDVIIVESE